MHPELRLVCPHCGELEWKTEDMPVTVLPGDYRIFCGECGEGPFEVSLAERVMAQEVRDAS